MSEGTRRYQEGSPWPRRITLALFLAIIVTVFLIMIGTFDPQTAGKLVKTWQLERQVGIAPGPELTWLETPLPATDYTIRLTAAWIKGEQDIGYGLLLGDEYDFLAVAVSPLGYLTIWRGPEKLNHNAEGTDPSLINNQLLPWQTWPHVRFGDSNNEIWVDGGLDRVTSVRINRELLWQGEETVPGRRIGFWALSYDQPATVVFKELQLFAAGLD